MLWKRLQTKWVLQRPEEYQQLIFIEWNEGLQMFKHGSPILIPSYINTNFPLCSMVVYIYKKEQGNGSKLIPSNQPSLSIISLQDIWFLLYSWSWFAKITKKLLQMILHDIKMSRIDWFNLPCWLDSPILLEDWRR